MQRLLSISVVMPALNEENNIRNAARDLMAVFRETEYDWEIILIDDGSTDATSRIIDEIARGEPRVRAIHHDVPRGIGYSFIEGITGARKDVVTWLPGDGENDPREILKYLPLMQHVDIVIPFVINKKVRTRLRRWLSAMYLTIINTSFRTRFNYTNGNIIYRRSIFSVVKPRSNGFLVHAECLVRATRAGFSFAEVPVTLKKRFGGDSKAMLLRSFLSVCGEFLSLLWDMQIKSRMRSRAGKNHNMQ